MTRKLPALTPDTAPFWQGGEHNELRIHHCPSCARFFHPPTPICPRCASPEVGPRVVSGRGKVISFTINYQPWRTDLQEPYVVAVVELAEQAGLHFVTNIIDMEPTEVAIDMPVNVVFSQVEDVWLPLFRRTT